MKKQIRKGQMPHTAVSSFPSTKNVVHYLCSACLTTLAILCAGCQTAFTSAQYKISFETPPGYDAVKSTKPNVIAAYRKYDPVSQPTILVMVDDLSSLNLSPQQTLAEYARNSFWAGINKQPELQRLGESTRKIGSEDAVVAEYTYRGKENNQIWRVRQMSVVRNRANYRFAFLTAPDRFDSEAKNFDTVLNSVRWLP